MGHAVCGRGRTTGHGSEFEAHGRPGVGGSSLAVCRRSTRPVVDHGGLSTVICGGRRAIDVVVVVAAAGRRHGGHSRLDCGFSVYRNGAALAMLRILRTRPDHRRSWRS